MTIQWFPGHMTKARRMIADSIKLVDAVCEIVDARIPYSSRNPDMDEISGGRPRIIVLNRVDQADPALTAAWRGYFAGAGAAVLETDSKSGKGVAGLSAVVNAVLADKLERYAERGQAGRKLRLLVAGIPNVGKSSFINRVAKRKAAATSDRPGVTRGKQWISVDSRLELMDTPGILWPKFEDRTVAENLAFTGAIRDEIMDTETLGANLLMRLSVLYPQSIADRYKVFAGQGGSVAGQGGSVAGQGDTGFDLLAAAAKNRGFLVSGGEFDLLRMATVLLDEFRGGKLGRITLERAPQG
ncbi:MAG: ribosome biogenesis GTPase YlqF [Oscillospiraceae bacterium]|nr:ribosome biogenesis GTPase YlqF [Oscillospiraceae bacterium]